ncbi:MAG: flavodoxin family protein [Thermodesulfobacteriota bacterium]
MLVLGISGSPRRGKTTDRLVREVLNAVEVKTEFISLAGKKIAPCSACLACLRDNRCPIKDDMAAIRESILAADGLVIGAPNYFANLNGITHAMLERLCQFRHRSGAALAGKPTVVVGTGGLDPSAPASAIEKMLPYFQLRHVGTVTAQGAASCFSCGHGEECSNGAVQMLHAPGIRITRDIVPDLANQHEALRRARLLGGLLSEHLRVNPASPTTKRRQKP